MQVDGFSLEAQKDRLRRYAYGNDMQIVGEYSDAGFSGKNIQGRADFQRMLNDIEAQKDDVSYVLVFKLSRFGRNAADVLYSLQLMQDYGVNLICVEDGIDSSKEAGKLMISVISAVAEIERENIRTQTMAGREQKAREGRWNGGFAPYGYTLKDGNLVVVEDEAAVIRVIFERYIHTSDGIHGVAEYLNKHGYQKKVRQNGYLQLFSRSFVDGVLDNPVYMGKIAYGRRRTEKKVGTRNEMHVIEQDEFPVYDGQHEAIVSEEDWNLAQAKKQKRSFQRDAFKDPSHAHILSGILICPCCGKKLYGNVSKAHSKDKKTRYYYYCRHVRNATGHECTFRTSIDQAEIDRIVARVISAMVHDERFATAIQAKIGKAINTDDLEQELQALQANLRQVENAKSRLETQMDLLDDTDPHYDRKMVDLQRRYDEKYDVIAELEEQIGEVRRKIRNIHQEVVTSENIYKILLSFDDLYSCLEEKEKKELMQAMIEKIEIFSEKRKDGCWIRSITFKFPLPTKDGEIREFPLESLTTLESIVTLIKETAKE
jgi:site-specific DNA recombinase